MTDHSADEIRDLLARAMSDSPEPHPWAEVDQRARRHDAPPPVRRRTGIWLAAAACTIALIGGLVAVVSSNDESKVRTDNPNSTTPSTAASTSAPAPTTTVPAPPTTALKTESGWTGGLLDDINVDSLRGLDSFAEGDVIVPTTPRRWRVSESVWTDPDDAIAPDFIEWVVEVTEARPNNGFGQVLYLTQSREPTCTTTLGCKPSGESVTINGVVWESIVVERIPEDDDQFVDATTVRARVGDRWVSLAAGAPQLLTGPLLDNPPIIEFLEGLRVGSPDDLTVIGQACWQCGAAGAEGDPFAVVESPSVTPTTMPDDTPTASSEPQAQAPSDFDSDTGRPLTDLAKGDVVVPTYIPPGLALQSTAQIHEYATADSEFFFTLETADGSYSNAVRLWESSGTVGPLGPRFIDDPNHPPVEIAGLTWGWYDFETARIANVGEFEVWVYLDGLDKLEAERLIEGLRAVSIDQFPGAITFDGADGLSVIDPNDLNDLNDPDIVASDNQFELTAVQVGDQVCTKLEETTVPVTATFSANCTESAQLEQLGIVDLYPLDPTDTKHLIIGVVDSPSPTVVRITSPDGESVVVPTGPVNQVIDGRFFRARLDLDVSNGIRLDQFTIEDASP
jgi:hypothetical protein